MFSALDVSASGLEAQRIRVNAIASNIANMTTARDANGDLEPYKAKFTIFETDPSVGSSQDGSVGVKVAAVEEETKEPLYRFEPYHPLAIKEGPRKGYVAYPNVDLVNEMVDSIEASRAYEANIGAIDISKNMFRQSLRILG